MTGRVRLTLLYAGATLLCLLLLGGIFAAGERGRTFDAFDADVRARVRTAAQSLTTRDDVLQADAICGETGNAPALDVIVVFDRAAQPVCAMPRDSIAQNAVITDLARAVIAQPRAATAPATSHDLRFVALPATDANGALLGVVVGGRAFDDVESATTATYTALAVLLPAAVVASLIIGFLLATYAARPMTRLTRALANIARSDTRRRLPIRRAAPDAALRQSINDLLNGLTEAGARQQRFAADASHELRTPLSVIEAEATLALRRERSPQDYQQALQTIVGETEHMRRLIDDLLTLARADAGLANITSRPVDVCDVVVEAVERVGALARTKGVTVAPRLPGDDAAVMVAGDDALLARMLGNLLKNAIAFTDPGGRVEAGARRDPNACRLWVSDNGIGIAPEHLPHIFDRFYRAKTTGERAESGGLGLAICQWIAQAHGGRVDVSSVAGAGTIFIVSLPPLPATGPTRVIPGPLAAPDPITFTSAMTAPIITATAPYALTRIHISPPAAPPEEQPTTVDAKSENLTP